MGYSGGSLDMCSILHFLATCMNHATLYNPGKLHWHLSQMVPFPTIPIVKYAMFQKRQE